MAPGTRACSRPGRASTDVILLSIRVHQRGEQSPNWGTLSPPAAELEAAGRRSCGITCGELPVEPPSRALRDNARDTRMTLCYAL